jgi:hypothetical protein
MRELSQTPMAKRMRHLRAAGKASDTIKDPGFMKKIETEIDAGLYYEEKREAAEQMKPLKELAIRMVRQALDDLERKGGMISKLGETPEQRAEYLEQEKDLLFRTAFNWFFEDEPRQWPFWDVMAILGWNGHAVREALISKLGAEYKIKSVRIFIGG